MMVDVEMETDDIDVDRETVGAGRIEMARDKLTEQRIARSRLVAKRKSGPYEAYPRKSKPQKLRTVLRNYPLGKKFPGLRLSGIQRTTYAAK